MLEPVKTAVQGYGNKEELTVSEVLHSLSSVHRVYFFLTLDNYHLLIIYC